MTKLAIITINYNNASGLQKTMESVFSQTNKNFEYLVIDGASTDNSLDIIQYFDKLNTMDKPEHTDHLNPEKSPQRLSVESGRFY